jgi:hypothetical protein
MSAFDTSLAQLAYAYALKHVKREIRRARLLSFIPSNRRLLVVLEDHKAMLERREQHLGKRRVA